MHNSEAPRRRLRQDESGFTLVELLVTMIIIGILAAIALALFLTQQQKARDSSMKSDIGGLVTEVEACHVERDDFNDCDDSIDLGAIGLAIDETITPDEDDACPTPGFGGLLPEPGKLAVVVSGERCYVIAGTSEAQEGGTNHIFLARRAPNGDRTRTCGPPGIEGEGGCRTGGSW